MTWTRICIYKQLNFKNEYISFFNSPNFFKDICFFVTIMKKALFYFFIQSEFNIYTRFVSLNTASPQHFHSDITYSIFFVINTPGIANLTPRPKGRSFRTIVWLGNGLMFLIRMYRLTTSSSTTQLFRQNSRLPRNSPPIKNPLIPETLSVSLCSSLPLVFEPHQRYCHLLLSESSHVYGLPGYSSPLSTTGSFYILHTSALSN